MVPLDNEMAKKNSRTGKELPAKSFDLATQNPTEIRDLGDHYVSAFVTFLDVLAFKELVRQNSPEIINSQLDAMLAFSQIGQRRREVYLQPQVAPMILQFSDSIIRIQPIPELDGVKAHDLLIGELNALAMLQGNLACNGILIRGGLTHGQVCVRNSRVFGPAFIRAYEIESKLARHPRIVVDERICRVDSQHPFLNQESQSTVGAFNEACSEFLERNDDGQFAVQYLSHLYEAEHPGGVKSIDVLRAHRDQLERLRQAVEEPKLEEARAKVRWAISYHNRWISRAFDRLDKREFQSTGRGLAITLD